MGYRCAVRIAWPASPDPSSDTVGGHGEPLADDRREVSEDGQVENGLLVSLAPTAPDPPCCVVVGAWRGPPALGAELADPGHAHRQLRTHCHADEREAEVEPRR